MSEPVTGQRELLGLTLPQLEEALTERGLEPFRARQVYEWVYRKNVSDFEAMSNLGKELRASLASSFKVGSMQTHQKQQSQRDGTAKFLFKLEDGQLIESVFLPHEGRNTACLSTQVGCAMACAFCATGDSGYGRNLSSAEIVGQVRAIEKELGQEVHNLVYMGMGEPFHNWPAVRESLETLTSPAGRQWGPRKITVSTCGLVPGILALAESGLKVRLAISLHSGNDETRARIMPINKRHPLKELLAACRKYQAVTGLQVTFEYTLFKGINDTREAAREVVKLLRGIESKVNLIPYNPVSGLGFEAPSFDAVAAFQEELRHGGLITMVRTEKGGDIDAACGQLRRRAA